MSSGRRQREVGVVATVDAECVDDRARLGIGLGLLEKLELSWRGALVLGRDWNRLGEERWFLVEAGTVLERSASS